MKKKFLSLVLILTMLTSICTFTPLSVSAKARNDACGDNLSYLLNGDVLTIDGNGDMYDFRATVNAIVGEKKRPWDSDGIKKVIIEKDVKTIGAYAFYNFEELSEVVIKSDVESIGDYAFYGCKELQNIQLPESVKTIGELSFAGCDKLKNIVLGKNVAEIGEQAFQNCKALTSITLHDNIEFIGKKAFYGCDVLTDVKYQGVGEGTKMLFEENRKTNEAVFAMTKGKCGDNISWKLENDTLTVSGTGKIECDKISREIFKKINAKKLVIESGITELNEAFVSGNQSFEQIVLPNTLEKLGTYTFRGCKNVSEIVFPDNEFVIDGGCFEGCTNLTRVFIPEKAKLTGYMPFGEIGYGNSNRIDITFYTPENSPAYNWAKSNDFNVVASTRDEFNKKIEKNEPIDTDPTEDKIPVEGKIPATGGVVYTPFSEYKNINIEPLNLINSDFLELRLKYGDVSHSEVWEGGYIYYFKNYDFAVSCYGVVGSSGYADKDELVMPNPLDVCHVAYCKLKDLIYGLDKEFYTVEELSEHTGVKFEKRHNAMDDIYMAYANIDGVDVYIYLNNDNMVSADEGVELYADWKDNQLKFYLPSKIGLDVCKQKDIYYYVGNTIVRIDESASGEIIIPRMIDGQKITKIHENVLGDNTDITKVTIEPGIIEIQDCAFSDAIGLKEVIMPNTIRHIGAHAFYGCSSLKTADIPTGVVKIGNGAFGACKSLTFARIPVSLFDMGQELFRDCEALETVAYLNTEAVDRVFPRFDGQVKNVVLGREKSYIPFKDFMYGGTVENILITAPRVVGFTVDPFTGSSIGSSLRSPSNIWCVGDKSDIRDPHIRWKEENITEHCNPYDFPLLYEYVRGYDTITIVFNNKILLPDQRAFITDGRTMVPMRIIFEAMGMSVEWDDNTKTVTAKGNGHSVVLQNNNQIATVDGEQRKLDVPATIVNGRMMVPVRFVSESAGARVEWNESQKFVDIYYGPATEIHQNSIKTLRGESYSFQILCDLMKNSDRSLSDLGNDILLIADDPYAYFSDRIKGLTQVILLDALTSSEAMDYIENSSIYTYCYAFGQEIANIVSVLSEDGNNNAGVCKLFNDLKLNDTIRKYKNISDLKTFTLSRSEINGDILNYRKVYDEALEVMTIKQKQQVAEMNTLLSYNKYLENSQDVLDVLNAGGNALENFLKKEALKNAYEEYYEGLILLAESTRNDKVREGVLELAEIMKRTTDEQITAAVLEFTGNVVIGTVIPKIAEKLGKELAKVVFDNVDNLSVVKDLSLLFYETFDKSLTKAECESDLLVLCEIENELHKLMNIYLDMSDEGIRYIDLDPEYSNLLNADEIITTDAVKSIGNLLVPVMMYMSELSRNLGNSEHNTIWEFIKDIADDGTAILYDLTFDEKYKQEMELFNSVELLY